MKAEGIISLFVPKKDEGLESLERPNFSIVNEKEGLYEDECRLLVTFLKAAVL